MFKYVVQIIIGMLVLTGSTIVAWYEGSTIIDKPWEWRYSTPFSQLFKTEVVTGREISQLDYFVYAAKYEPLFPIMMVISLFYIVAVIGVFFMNYHVKWAIVYGGFISSSLVFFAIFAFNASTEGGTIFFYMALMMGIIMIMGTSFAYFKHAKSPQTL